MKTAPPPESESNVSSHAEASRFKSKGGLRRILHAAQYSSNGLREAWRCESSFRQETILAVILSMVAILLPLDLVLTGLVIGSMLMVLAVELLNSSVEWAVDYISTNDHPLARRIKDMSSAAVTISLLHSAMWWVIAGWSIWG